MGVVGKTEKKIQFNLRRLKYRLVFLAQRIDFKSKLFQTYPHKSCRRTLISEVDFRLNLSYVRLSTLFERSISCELKISEETRKLLNTKTYFIENNYL